MGQTVPHAAGEAPVFIVDDDSSVSEALTLVLRLEGFATRTFNDGSSFLEAVRSVSPVCVILDLQLPGCPGLKVLEQLASLQLNPPIIVISGQSDIATAVTAMKYGALDFLEKPFTAHAVVERVRQAIADRRRRGVGGVPGFSEFPGRHLLTERECEVLGQVANGASNKEAGRRLGISPRTVEVHRARIMTKLGARNAADLMRIVLTQNVVHLAPETPRRKISAHGK